LFQLGPGATGESLGSGPVRVAEKILPDLVVAETSAELPLGHMVGALSSAKEGVGVIGELLPVDPPRGDGLAVTTAITLPVAAVIYLLMPGMRSDFRDFFLLLLAAPILLLSGIAVLAETIDVLKRRILTPSAFHIAGAVAAYFYGVSLVMQAPMQGEGGRYFLYALTLAALPVLYKLGPSISRHVFFRWILPSSLPAYLDIEEEGDIRPIPTYRVTEGMMIVLRAGMTVPVECAVRTGQGEVDYIGIPDVLAVRPGDIIHAGMVVRSGEFHAQVIHVPDVRLVEASTRLRIASCEPRPYDQAMNLMSALAILVVMAGMVFRVHVGGQGWTQALVISLAVAGALPLEAVELLGRLADSLFADLAAVRGIACGEHVRPAALAAVKEIHLPEGSIPQSLPSGVCVKTEGVPRPGEAILISGPESSVQELHRDVIKVFVGAKEGVSKDAAILLTGRAGELWTFFAGVTKVRRAGILAYVFSLSIGCGAALLAAAGVIPVYVALVFGALGALWGEMILASSIKENR